MDHPEGAFLPMSSIDESTGKLEGFFWIFDKKPITKYDIIRNNNAFQIERMKALRCQKGIGIESNGRKFRGSEGGLIKNLYFRKTVKIITNKNQLNALLF
ncbi:MAG: hypothetical protein IPN93_09675 [Bacteroidetes bacterium]|nr:hypothetical protein [Bacteroidota bacterium]